MKEKLRNLFLGIDGQPVMPNVLIVEDDSTTRILLRLFLSKIGFDVSCFFEAANGVQGLQLFEEKEIDMVFTDINMPQMDGLEMLARIQEFPNLDFVPSIVVSSERDRGLIRTVISNGYGFVPKPLAIGALENEILNLESLRYADYV